MLTEEIQNSVVDHEYFLIQKHNAPYENSKNEKKKIQGLCSQRENMTRPNYIF